MTDKSMRRIINVITEVFITALCMILASCSKPQLSDDEKCSAVCEIAGICLDQWLPSRSRSSKALFI
jgi:hypothetical protein